MELHEFISGSLVQIAKGLRKANTDLRKLDEDDNRPRIEREHFALLPGSKDATRMVEFDVAITARREVKGSGGAKFSVWVVDANIDAGGAHTREEVSRLKFAVAVEQSIY